MCDCKVSDIDLIYRYGTDELLKFLEDINEAVREEKLPEVKV